MSSPRALLRAASRARIPSRHAFPRRAMSTPATGFIPMPIITEVTSGGWRTSDIFSKLLQERIICLYGQINETTSASIVSQLLWLESDDPDKPITMYINSDGGRISSGLAIYDTMTYIRPEISTICIGSAASMAALLLLAGAPQKRFALPHASIMVHQPLGGTQGQASDIIIYANQIQRTRDQVNEIYRKHVNLALGPDHAVDASTVAEIMERDRYLTPLEAKELGIIDNVLERRDAVKPGEGVTEAGN